MGFISDFSKGKEHWNRVFQGTNKEEPHKQEPPKAKSERTYSSFNSFKRLLEAFQSKAPGGWSDDRWEQTKHFLGIAYVCIHRSSEQMSQAEYQVYKKDPKHQDGMRLVSDGEEGYDLVKLLDCPNNEDSFGDLMYQWNQQLDLTGMALTWIVPNMIQSKIEGKGTPVEMYSIPTAMAIPQPIVTEQFPQGYYRIQPLYPYGPFSSYGSPTSSAGAIVPAEWVVRMKYHHPFLRYDGYSPLTGVREHIDVVREMDRSRFYSMKRSVNPSAVLNFDGVDGMQSLSQEEIERIHIEWNNEYQGSDNHGKLIVGTPGGRLDQWGTRPIDMDYQQGWDQLVSFVMCGLGMIKSVAGMTSDTSYSTLYASLKQLAELFLQPKCDRVGRVLTKNVAPYFGRGLLVKVNCKKINDHEIEQQNVKTLMDAKAITKNEVRKALGHPLTHEKWGNEIAGFEEQKQEEGQNPLLNKQGGDNPLLNKDEQEEERDDPEELSKDSLGSRNGKFHMNGRKHAFNNRR